MDAIRHRAICLNLATHIESLGNGHSVVFHSTVGTHTHTLQTHAILCIVFVSCLCVVYSGNSQEERGLWESESLVALDT